MPAHAAEAWKYLQSSIIRTPPHLAPGQRHKVEAGEGRHQVACCKEVTLELRHPSCGGKPPVDARPSKGALSGSFPIYYMFNAGTFPKPVKISERAIGWKESSVDEWIAKSRAA